MVISWFFLGEVGRYDTVLRTLVNALAAQTAFVRIYVRKVVLKRDSLKLAGLDTFAATYAGSSASLLGHRTLVLVDAAYINPAVQLVPVTQFNHTARAGLGAGTACSTLFLVNHRQTRLGIHLDGIELSGILSKHSS